MDLKRILNGYSLNIPKSEEQPKMEPSPKKDIDYVMPGKEVSNEHGKYYMIENLYPLSYFYGGVRFENLFDMNNEVFTCLSGNGCLDVNKMIFVDTETTGLSSGSGTIPFLIGTGKIQKDGFCVKQYFMRDYNEEAAVLYDLTQILQNAESVVTYNGKSFDMPLINTRFIANRFRLDTTGLVHLDLLHIARLFWKGYFENCRLCTIEEKILGEIRIDDIPGEKIPLEYFRYLDTRDATVMGQVIKHNLYDILSLAALLVRFSTMVSNRNNVDNINELYGLSKLYEKCDDYISVIECLERTMQINTGDWNIETVKRISMFYKRTGRYDKAVEMWNCYYYSDNCPSLGLKVFVGTELAKYFEHKIKEYRQALFVVNNLLSHVRGKSFLGRIYLNDLEKRRKRLERIICNLKTV